MVEKILENFKFTSAPNFKEYSFNIYNIEWIKSKNNE